MTLSKKLELYFCGTVEVLTINTTQASVAVDSRHLMPNFNIMYVHFIYNYSNSCQLVH